MLRIVGYLMIAFLLLNTGGRFLCAQTVDTVFVGSLPVKDAKLFVGTETFHSYKLENGQKNLTSITRQTITPLQAGVSNAYLIESVHVDTKGDTTLGMLIIKASDFSLIHHKVKATADSAAVTCYGHYLTGWVVLPGQPVRLIDLKTPRPVFPVDGPQPWLVSLLPLREGYSALVPRFNMWRGKEIWSSIKVLGGEMLEHHGQRVDCWKVDAGPMGPPGYRSYRWVEKATGRVLQSVLQGEAGQVEYWTLAE